MLKIRTIISLCCMAGLVFSVSGQELWTFEQCIRYAFDNNIRLKQQELEVEFAENNLLQSKINLLPNLNASGNFNSSKGKVLDQNTFTVVDGATVNSLTANIGSSVTLFKGLQQKNAIDRNRFSLLASIQDVEKLKNDLTLNIASSYLQILYAQEQLAVAENQLALTLLQVKRTETLVEAGSQPEGALFDIQSQAAREELLIVTAQNDLDLSKLNLMQLLDLQATTIFHIVVPDFSNIGISELTGSVDDVFATAENILPQIKSAEYNLKSIEKQLSISRGYRSPTLTFSAGTGSRYSSSASPRAMKDDAGNTYFVDFPLKEQLDANINSYIGLGLSIPIFNGWQVQTGIKNAKLNVKNYQYQLQLTKNTLYKEIQQAQADAAASLKKYIASTKAVTSVEESFRYTEQRYEAGIMNFVDYSTAKTRLISAQADLLQAKFEYIFKTKVLDFYSGQPITL